MESSRSRKPLVIALGLVVAWVGLMAFKADTPVSEPTTDAPLLAMNGGPATADYAWPLLDLDDKPTDLSRFRGKPLVLNVWATWCPPCRKEMPSLAALAADPKFKALGGEVVCVSTDNSADVIRSILQGKAWSMTMLRASSFPSVFFTESIPATYLIAPDGRVLSSQVGAARWDDPSVVAFLEKFARPAP